MCNVLLTITGLAMGGAENQVVSLADQFAQQGLDVTIAYVLQPAVVLPKNPRVRLIWLGGTKSPLGILKACKNLVSLIRKYKPDVVHSHMFHANILSRLARLFAPVPRLISTAHNTHEGGKLRMLAYRLTNRLANVFTNVSEDAVQAFEHKGAVPAGHMLPVTNGIDTRYFAFDAGGRNQLRLALGLHDATVYIAIGRFHEQKDYPNLLQAFRLLIAQGQPAHLLVVGDGELRPAIEQLINQLELQGKVSLLGIRRDIPQLLSAADVFVLSSAWEGFGLVVAEAMACERIAIGTDSGGVASVIGDDDTGYIVPVRNPDALADAMLAAAALDPEAAKVLGCKARARVLEQYSLEAAVKKWLEIYELSGK